MAQAQTKRSNAKTGILWAASLVLTALTAWFAATLIPGAASNRPDSRQILVREMRINLARASDREKLACMASSDEASRNYAEQSGSASDAVERDRRSLEKLLAREGTGRDRAVLDEFGRAWEALRLEDAELLELAGQNTNLKAAELAGAICAELRDKFRYNLARLAAKSAQGTRRAETEKLGTQAENTLLRISLLQLRHIDAPTAAEKQPIEAGMKREAEKEGALLQSLASAGGRKNAAIVKEASGVFDQFMQVNEEIVRLSNINTNHSAVERSLGRRRLADAECDRLLRELARDEN
jgi:hypothetical protein